MVKDVCGNTELRVIELGDNSTLLMLQKARQLFNYKIALNSGVLKGSPFATNVQSH